MHQLRAVCVSTNKPFSLVNDGICTLSKVFLLRKFSVVIGDIFKNIPKTSPLPRKLIEQLKGATARQ